MIQLSYSQPKIIVTLTVVALSLLPACGTNPFGSKETYLRRGDQFVQKGKFEDAALQYRKALQKDDKYGLADLHYGRLLVQMNKSVDAFEPLFRASVLLPESDEAAAALGRVSVDGLLGHPDRPRLFYDTAGRMADRLLAAHPRSSEGLRIKGYLAISDNHPAQAIEYFRQSLQSKPGQPDVTTMLVQTLLLDRRGEEAEKIALDALTRMKNQSPLYDALYGYYMSSGRTADAEGLLKRKIDNNPGQSFFVIQLADYYWTQKKTAEAQDLLRRLAAGSGRYRLALRDAGDFYRRVGKPDEAVSSYWRGLQADPAAVSDPGMKKIYFRRILETRLAQGALPEATAAVDAILRESPDDIDALTARADLKMATGRPDDLAAALAEFAALIKKVPDNNRVRRNYAQALRKSGKIAEARAVLAEALRRDSNDRDALRETASLAIHEQKPDEALRYAERLLALDPDDTDARLVRTAAWALQRRFDEVRMELRRITTEKSNVSEAWLQMAALEVESRNYSEAEKIFRRLFRPGSGDLRPVRGLVGVYILQREHQKALALARSEASASPTPEFRMLLASTAADAGDLDLAVATAQKLAADFTGKPEHLIFAGQMLQRKGQMDAAVADFEKACSEASSDPLPLAYLADALWQAGRAGEAVAAARRRLSIQPGDAGAMNSLAWFLALSGQRLDEAKSLIERALQQDPGNAAFLDTAGIVYLKSRRLDDALRITRRVVGIEPGRAAYRTHLAEALLASGNRQQARRELQGALENHPSDAEARQIRQLLKEVS